MIDTELSSIAAAICCTEALCFIEPSLISELTTPISSIDEDSVFAYLSIEETTFLKFEIVSLMEWVSSPISSLRPGSAFMHRFPWAISDKDVLRTSSLLVRSLRIRSQTSVQNTMTLRTDTAIVLITNVPKNPDSRELRNALGIPTKYIPVTLPLSSLSGSYAV